MPRFYRRQLAGTLETLVQESLESDPSEQLNLMEELALMRATASQSVALYSVTMQAMEGKSDERSVEMMAAAGSLMRDALEHVAQMCKDATTVSMAQSDRISAHSINFIMRQIVSVAHEVFGEAVEHPNGTVLDLTPLLERFDERLRRCIRVPGQRTMQGTLLRPDGGSQDQESYEDGPTTDDVVRDMDDMVPDA